MSVGDDREKTWTKGSLTRLSVAESRDHRNQRRRFERNLENRYVGEVFLAGAPNDHLHFRTEEDEMGQYGSRAAEAEIDMMEVVGFDSQIREDDYDDDFDDDDDGFDDPPRIDEEFRVFVAEGTGRKFFHDARELDSETEQCKYIEPRLYQNLSRYASDLEFPSDDNFGIEVSFYGHGDQSGTADERLPEENPPIQRASSRRTEAIETRPRRKRDIDDGNAIEHFTSNKREQEANKKDQWNKNSNSSYTADGGDGAINLANTVTGLTSGLAAKKSTRRIRLNLDREREVITDAIMRLRRVENRLMRRGSVVTTTSTRPPQRHVEAAADAPTPAVGVDKLNEAEEVINRIHEMCDQLRGILLKQKATSRSSTSLSHLPAAAGENEPASAFNGREESTKIEGKNSLENGTSKSAEEVLKNALHVIKEAEEEVEEGASRMTTSKSEEASARASPSTEVAPTMRLNRRASVPLLERTRSTETASGECDPSAMQTGVNRRFSNLVVRENGMLKMVEMEVQDKKSRSRAKNSASPRPKKLWMASKQETASSMTEKRDALQGGMESDDDDDDDDDDQEASLTDEQKEQTKTKKKGVAPPPPPQPKQSAEPRKEAKDFTFKSLKHFWNKVEEDGKGLGNEKE